MTRHRHHRSPSPSDSGSDSGLASTSSSSKSDSSSSASDNEDDSTSSSEEAEERKFARKKKQHGRRRGHHRTRRRHRDHHQHHPHEHHHHLHRHSSPVPQPIQSNTALWALVGVVVLFGGAILLYSIAGSSDSQSGELHSSVLTSIQSGKTVLITRTVSAPTSSTTSASTGPELDLDSLSASFGLSPAAVPSLPFPNGYLSSSNAETMDWIRKEWPYISGSSGFLTFVEDPFPSAESSASNSNTSVSPSTSKSTSTSTRSSSNSTSSPSPSPRQRRASTSSGSQVLQIEYPKGSLGGDGGVGGLHLAVFGEGQGRGLVSYQVAFSESFDWVLCGKLPGAFGGSPELYCSGGEISEGCFSLRLMWREKGAGEVYAYIPTYPTQCEEEGMMCHNGGTPISLKRGAWTFRAGVWQTITQLVLLNSDPSSSSTKSNGRVAIWVDGSKVMDLENLVIRTNDSVGLSSFVISSFFGGSTANYASKGGFSYFKNFQFYSASTPSDSEGEMVKPNVDYKSAGD